MKFKLFKYEDYTVSLEHTVDEKEIIVQILDIQLGVGVVYIMSNFRGFWSSFNKAKSALKLLKG
jgi:hypothetical protein